MANVLIVEDDKGVNYTISSMVERMGHHVTQAYSIKETLEKLHLKKFDLALLDVRLPDGNGLDIIKIIRETPSNPEVIIITAYGEPDGAEVAIKNGAWDYIEKPSSVMELSFPFIRALQYREEKKSKKITVSLNRDGIIGSNPQMRACFDLLAQAAGSEANVLITGETGTGKELFAQAIHENSPRAAKNFVVVDCTTLPDTLVESILFGYKKGAFTGADKSQEGLIRQADGGTLFLDEVGELPLSIQKGFLRVLQERRFRPLGEKQEIESRFRLVAATNRDLDSMAKSGDFRKDLLYRLRSFSIDLPALRDHMEDIRALAMFHVARLCEHYKTVTKGFSPEFFDVLSSYDWPGNVRELFNALERALVASTNEPILFPNHLPTYIRVKVAQTSLNHSKGNRDELSPVDRFEDFTQEEFPRITNFRIHMERQYLKKLMQLSYGSKKKACRISGLSRTRLFELLKKHNISN